MWRTVTLIVCSRPLDNYVVCVFNLNPRRQGFYFARLLWSWPLPHQFLYHSSPRPASDEGSIILAIISINTLSPFFSTIVI